MAHSIEDGGCEPFPHMINIPDPVYQSMQGNYFVGQTRLLLFGDGMHAWGGLVNPPNSGVNVHINIFTISNYTSYPFVAQVWFNAAVQCPFEVSSKVICANTAIRPVPRPKAQLQFAESVSARPEGGINPLSRIVGPKSSEVAEKKGLYIIPPGGCFTIYLVPPGSCLMRGRIALGWWEAQC